MRIHHFEGVSWRFCWRMDEVRLVGGRRVLKCHAGHGPSVTHSSLRLSRFPRLHRFTAATTRNGSWSFASKLFVLLELIEGCHDDPFARKSIEPHPRTSISRCRHPCRAQLQQKGLFNWYTSTMNSPTFLNLTHLYASSRPDHPQQDPTE